MSRLGRREYFLFHISDKNIESLIDEIIYSISPSNKYDLSVYPGKYGVNVVVEIVGANTETIKDADLKVSSKVLEICEKRGIECHVMQRSEII